MLQAWVRLPQQKHFLFKGVLAGSIETDKMKSCYLAIPKMMKKIFPCHLCGLELGLFYFHILRARISLVNVFSVKILAPGIQTGNFGEGKSRKDFFLEEMEAEPEVDQNSSSSLFFGILENSIIY